MRSVRLLTLAVLAAGSLLFTGAESKAEVITLPKFANDLEGNSFTVPTAPGLTFSFQQVAASGTVVKSSIEVRALPPSGFQLVQGGINAGSGMSGELFLNFTVASATPITQVTLFATGVATGNGSALISETITDDTDEVIGNTMIGSGSTVITLTKASTLIKVSQSIAINGGTQPGQSGASYSDIRQTFTTSISQAPAPIIPEPTSVVMLGAGMVGVLAIGLRRTKSVA